MISPSLSRSCIRPAVVIDPPVAPSLTDQVTTVSKAPVTVAVNWSVPIASSVANAALTFTATAVTVTAIVADCALSAWLVAMTW